MIFFNKLTKQGFIPEISFEINNTNSNAVKTINKN